MNPVVTNNGKLIADGGEIQISAASAANTLTGAINIRGLVQAKSVSKHNGVIIISGNTHGGIVTVSGRINASGTKRGQTGGSVAITGYDILLNPSASINVSGDVGGGNINVGGSEHGAGPLANANQVIIAPNRKIKCQCTE